MTAVVLSIDEFIDNSDIVEANAASIVFPTTVAPEIFRRKVEDNSLMPTLTMVEDRPTEEAPHAMLGTVAIRIGSPLQDVVVVRTDSEEAAQTLVDIGGTPTGDTIESYLG